MDFRQGGKPMTEKIGVTYYYVVAGAYHMALFYENSAGEKQVIEVAPLFNQSQLSVFEMVGEFVKESWDTAKLVNRNDGSPFGFIVGGVRDWNAEDDMREKEVLVTSDDLSFKWGALVADATEALALHYEYRPFQQNSNTFVATLLEDVGLPQPARTSEFWTPAWGFRLHDPLVGSSISAEWLGSSHFTFDYSGRETTNILVDDPVDINVHWANGEITVTADGTNVLSLQDLPIDSMIGTTTSIAGVDGHVVLIGSSGDDTFDGHGSDCLMLGGPGDDIFLLGYGGSDWIDGGWGHDTAKYTQTNDP